MEIDPAEEVTVSEVNLAIKDDDDDEDDETDELEPEKWFANFIYDPGIFNLDQKFWRRNFFSYLLWSKTSEKQSRKTSGIGFHFELPAN